MSKPLVSVIIPTFNSSGYVLEAIESALQQTYSPIEIIVVDDGSSDDTREKLKHLIDSEKIRYHFQMNRGLAAARNAGIRLSKGHYLQFLDADDLILPAKIKQQVASLESCSESAICGCDFRFFDGRDTSHVYGGDIFQGRFNFQRASDLFSFETVIHRWLFPASLVKEAGNFEESPPGVWLMEDWLLLWKLAASGVRLLFVDAPLALYRRHGENMTDNFETTATGHFIALDHVERYQRQKALSLYTRRELNALRESYHYELGLFYLRRNSLARAWRHLLKALVLAPNRLQVKLLLVFAIPALRSHAIDWVGSADHRLWQWRGQLRKTLVG